MEIVTLEISMKLGRYHNGEVTQVERTGSTSLWLHHYAAFVTFATFLLILAGALVTSNDAGLSVPDWPTSFGTFRMPPMVGGVRFEHGHRMIAGTVSILTIVLASWLWRSEPRRWVRRVGAFAVVAILAQAVVDMEIQRALGAGAQGYVLKSMPPKDLVAVIRQVYAGKKRIPSEVAARLAEHLGEEDLTSREIEVLRYAAEGNRNRDIGEKLFISEETVKVHIKHIMEKLGASDRTQAVAIALRRGIIELGPDQSDRESSHQAHHKKAGYP
jgi:DNA-binding CsgD family transcriptional regulator